MQVSSVGGMGLLDSLLGAEGRKSFKRKDSDAGEAGLSSKKKKFNNNILRFMFCFIYAIEMGFLSGH